MRAHSKGCAKVYHKASNLQIHKRIHTGEKPYVCDLEGHSGNIPPSNELRRHKRKHNGRVLTFALGITRTVNMTYSPTLQPNIFEPCGSYPWAPTPCEGGPEPAPRSREGRKALDLVLGTPSCVLVGAGGPRWTHRVELHHQVDGTLPKPRRSMGQSESATWKECVISGCQARVPHTCAHTLLPTEGSGSGLSVSTPFPILMNGKLEDAALVFPLSQDSNIEPARLNPSLCIQVSL